MKALAEDADGQGCEGGEGVGEEECAVRAEHDGGKNEVAGVVGDGDGEVESGDLGGVPQRIGGECLRGRCCIKVGSTIGGLRLVPWNATHLVEIKCSGGAETANNGMHC